MWISISIYSLSTNLFLKQYKCVFGALEVEYLGHLVGKVDVMVDPKNIESMQDWTCLAQL
jgi:hypothetical protein